MNWRRAVFSVVLFSTAFGYLEASVVVYLRHIYDPIRSQLHPGKPPGELFPMITEEQLRAQGPEYTRLLVAELGREFCTLVMLAAVALAVSANARQWLAAFVLAFGVWDLVFYLGLKALIDWPASWMTWDILFLLPLPWVGPVLSPCIVAASMVVGGMVVLRRELGGPGLRLGAVHWAGLIGGGIILMVAFMWDWRNTMAGNWPNPFNWPLFVVGELLSVAAFAHAAWGRTSVSKAAAA